MGVEYRRRKNNKKKKKEEGRKTRQMTCGFHTLPNRNPLDFSVREGIQDTRWKTEEKTYWGPRKEGEEKTCTESVLCLDNFLFEC